MGHAVMEAIAAGVAEHREEIIAGILEEFLALCRIPHQSGHEEAISTYLQQRLGEMGYESRRDENFNVIADIPATPGLEDRPRVVLQAHMDMVVAAEPGHFDPQKDQVCPVIEGDILHTDGRSSLGADNGIGVAAILYAVGRPRLPHGPVRVIFTSCEEVGLRGAKLLDPEVFRDVKYLINLDGFHADRAVVGCMSGKRETYFHPMRTVQTMPGSVGIEIEISGFRGGHSGEDIGAHRCNAIRLMAEMLSCVKEKNFPVEIAGMDGGTGANVIPRTCAATLAVSADEKLAVERRIQEEFCWVTAAYQTEEHTPHLTFREIPTPRRVWSDSVTQDVLEAIRVENNGVYALSRQFRGTVGGSSNLGRIFSDENKVELQIMTRCESDDLEKKILHQHTQVAKRYGFSMGIVGYDAWHQEAINPLTTAVEDTYEENYHRHIKVMAAQVGLEPAYFHTKAPWMTMVTLGADIEDAHSTSERVHLSSLETMFRLMAGVLIRIVHHGKIENKEGSHQPCQ